MSYIYQASDEENNQNKPVGSPTKDVTRGVLFEGKLPHNAKVISIGSLRIYSMVPVIGAQ